MDRSSQLHAFLHEGTHVPALFSELPCADGPAGGLCHVSRPWLQDKPWVTLLIFALAVRLGKVRSYLI